MSLLSGGAAGILLMWLLRNWISERLQQSIRHEYSQKLETHKAELNSRIQAIQHENQLQQLRTSLFFDDQRNAFAGILAKMAEVNKIWVDEHYQEYEGLTGPIPSAAYRDLRSLFYTHQLFFDSACLAAIDLVLRFYTDSLPVDDGSGNLYQRDCDAAYDAIQFLQPRLAELFQHRIGVSKSRRSEREIALLGAIRLLNDYHFREIDIPPKGSLALEKGARPPQAIAKAEAHCDELVTKLQEFHDHLTKESGWFHEAALNASRYLEILSATGICD